MKLIKQSTTFIALAILQTQIAEIQAHGASSFPPSRQWVCSGGASPNAGVQWNGRNGPQVCSPDISGPGINTVITDWSGVAHGGAGGHSDTQQYQKDPRSAHVQVMGGLQAKVCSANLDKFQALDLATWTADHGPGDHQRLAEFRAYPTFLPNGPADFEYSVSAAHRTYSNGYIDSYITRDGTDFSKPITWEDLEVAPFCHYVPKDTNTPLQRPNMGSQEKYSCDIPKEKIGKHIIFQVWQRSDSEEAFYSCSDVVLTNEGDDVRPTTRPVERSTTVRQTTAPVIATTKSNLQPDCQMADRFSNLQTSSGSIRHANSNHCWSAKPGKNSKISKSSSCSKWQIKNTHQLSLSNSDYCLEIATSAKTALVNPTYNLRMNKCKDNKPNQAFQYNKTDGTVRSFIDDRYCAAFSGEHLHLRPCATLSQDGLDQFGERLE